MESLNKKKAPYIQMEQMQILGTQYADLLAQRPRTKSATNMEIQVENGIAIQARTFKALADKQQIIYSFKNVKIPFLTDGCIKIYDGPVSHKDDNNMKLVGIALNDAEIKPFILLEKEGNNILVPITASKHYLPTDEMSSGTSYAKEVEEVIVSPLVVCEAKNEVVMDITESFQVYEVQKFVQACSIKNASLDIIDNRI